MAPSRESERAAKTWTAASRETGHLQGQREHGPSNDARTQEPVQPPGYATRANRVLRQLCEACNRGDDFWRCLEAQRVLFEGWGDAEVPAQAPYPSNIGDDHSPYEFSLAFERGEGVELRLLVEAQAASPSARSNQAAALALNECLRDRFGVSLERFEAVRDLFIVDEPSAFSLWHAVCWLPGGDAEFKIYLNPEAAGPGRAHDVVVEAMSRLGFADRGRAIAHLTRRGDLDEIRYFSLDLSNAGHARVKVYAAHRGATASEIDSALEVSPSHRPGDVAEFCGDLVGHGGPFSARPVQTCLSFTSEVSHATAATFHFPIAHYLPQDVLARARVGDLLRRHGLDAAAYERSFDAMAAASAGVEPTQSYASFKRCSSGMRVTTYLSPHLFPRRP